MDDFVRSTSAIRHDRYMNRLHRAHIVSEPTSDNVVLLLFALQAHLDDLDAELVIAERRDVESDPRSKARR